MIQGYEKLSER